MKDQLGEGEGPADVAELARDPSASKPALALPAHDWSGAIELTPERPRRRNESAGDDTVISGRNGYFPLAITLSAIALGFAAIAAPAAAVIAAAGAGALVIMRERVMALLASAAMVALLVAVPAARSSAGCWSSMVTLAAAGTVSTHCAPALLRLPHWIWSLATVLGAASICVAFIGPPVPAAVATLSGSVCAGFIGAGLARYLAMADARILAWGEDGVMAVTRDLLLGRITGGMLHDLAQPLNVISMANGNLGYILEHLDIDPESRRQLIERIERISTHTEGAADILALFRGLGRDGAHGGPQNVRSALTRAVAATRSNVRHHVSVQIEGGALDYLVPGRNATLELLGVAALLSAFRAFADDRGRKIKGTVMLHAAVSPAHVVINVHCVSEQEQQLPCKPLDNATRWLVEQVARQAGGDFQCVPRSGQPTQLVIRMARDDI